jgi:glycosyltransferase involved in cell wall biosynthesis
MGDRRPVLLTVSGEIPSDLDEQVAEGRRPRADYRVIASVIDADLVDVASALAACGRVGRLVHRLGGVGGLLGWYAFRHRRSYEVVLTDGEQVGIPLALLTRLFGKRGCAHVMIVHILSVPKKTRLIRAARLAAQVDRYITYSSAQADYIVNELAVPRGRVVLSTFMVDTMFFDPARISRRRRRMICSAGLERRDYPTLIEAVEELDVDVVIAAASPWSKQHDSSADRALPANVEIRRLNLFELRQLYAESELLVMPLVDVDFQAGITTILEGMSMGLAVVCTRTRGQTDTIVHGQTGLYVPPHDVVALRACIVALLNSPAEASRLGSNARRWVIANADVERYAQAVSEVVRGLSAAR